jgi:tetratricopeptide (TPR) repeat protein
MFKSWQVKTFLITLIVVIVISFTIPGATQQQRLIFISQVQGIVQLKRPNWKIYQPAYFGDLLNPTDRLRLVTGASAKVICDNLQTWHPKSQGEFAVSQGCPSSTRQVLKRPNAKTSPPRTGNNPQIPYLISPRNTSILTLQPKFQWNSVAGATNYQVKILGQGVNWETKVTQPQVVYSGKQTFVPGLRYRVTITASNGASSKNNQDNPGFQVLSGAEIRRVKTEIAQLQRQTLNNESKTLALAHIYISNDLQTEAIDVLESSVKTGSSNTAVYQLLGNTYYQIGLVNLAKQRYLTAVKLAQAENNLEAQAIIQATLGEIDKNLEQLKPAFQWFQNAQSNYRALGDEAKVREMQEQIDYLQERNF